MHTFVRPPNEEKPSCAHRVGIPAYIPNGITLRPWMENDGCQRQEMELVKIFPFAGIFLLHAPQKKYFWLVNSQRAASVMDGRSKDFVRRYWNILEEGGSRRSPASSLMSCSRSF